MSFLRSSTMLRSAAFRPVLSTAPRARIQMRFASSDYGSGSGDPKGETPQEQGKSNATEDLEHPGPKAPNVGQDQPASGEQSSYSQSSSDNSKSGGGENSNSSAEKSKSSGDGKSVKGSKPKILNESPPAEPSEDVKQHNREMDNRADKAHEKIPNEGGDKVAPSYWKGTGGVDK
ncbi:hypothetical protein BCR34DRAFT_524424 [Clohesyomyces aquaticus]|uniref:Uncharacterized protein n=1 Tax=Clohesyomyces aquaticus TaxID=1231657 RepID=A0A1Y1YGW9_9PLEO|nr:hypothetical protein BCR34DRAFT_524424 [Clohesyomyces aquaticus]